MLELSEIRNDQHLVNAIDWDMTPEEAVYIVGKTVEKLGTRSMILVLAMIMGTCMIYVPGVIWLKTLTGMSWIKALTVGCIPFLPGDALKIVAAVSIYRVVRTVIRSV